MPDKMDVRARIRIINVLLVQKYGAKEQRRHDPLDTLVRTILSQNTNDVNRDRAFDELRRQLPTWESIRDAPPALVVSAIRTAGLANQKGPRMQEALRTITERAGKLSLDFLEDMDISEARAWLTSIKGIGPKTAAIVLCFSFGKTAFPVDTHVHRVSKRIGLIAANVNRKQAHLILEDLVPPEMCYQFHLNLIEHGRHVCKAGRPQCEICTITEYCDYFRNSL